MTPAVNAPHLVGPGSHDAAACEAVLRSLPAWFGIEEALLRYARDAEEMPTFAALQSGRIVGFLTLMQHFAQAWEVHCMAVHAESRNQGLGTALLAYAEAWLVGQGAKLLQVKTVAATSTSEAYALTRGFYARQGFLELEIFPELWSPRNPCLQLVKLLPAPAASTPPNPQEPLDGQP